MYCGNSIFSYSEKTNLSTSIASLVDKSIWSGDRSPDDTKFGSIGSEYCLLLKFWYQYTKLFNVPSTISALGTEESLGMALGRESLGMAEESLGMKESLGIAEESLGMKESLGMAEESLSIAEDSVDMAGTEQSHDMALGMTAMITSGVGTSGMGPSYEVLGTQSCGSGTWKAAGVFNPLGTRKVSGSSGLKIGVSGGLMNLVSFRFLSLRGLSQ